ncbi:hypothetical protein BV898_18064 [Hypsibius exemplaris]|uniref:Uncharacterized protein n=1 Tax=Hypsibius exemplaris TaxID=2072580 RepID=A0A9X6RMT2_HYPEX|nr:hypothetical protein BV898_18064 [Hypsibius exemplaris]
MVAVSAPPLRPLQASMHSGAGGRFLCPASSAATGPASFEYFAVFRMNRNGLCNMVVRSGYAVGVLAFNTYVPLCLVTIAALVVSRQLIYKSLCDLKWARIQTYVALNGGRS